MTVFDAIAMSTLAIDAYVVDTLMRDLVAHSRSSSSFLVYLQLYRYTHGIGRESVTMSYTVLAESSGLSKRSVQQAITHLSVRRLIRRKKSSPTATPVYTVLTPWIRKERS